MNIYVSSCTFLRFTFLCYRYAGLKFEIQFINFLKSGNVMALSNECEIYSDCPLPLVVLPKMQVQIRRCALLLMGNSNI